MNDTIGKQFASLSSDELKDDLGVQILGDRKKILLAAEQFKGESGDTSAPGGKGGASGGCSRQQGEIRSLRWPDGNSNDFGRYEGIAAQDGWQRVLIATERDDDPYRLIILSNNQIDFYDPPGGITGPVKTFKKPHLDDTYTHLLSCHVVGNTMLATGGCQVGSGSKATSICVLYDVASGEVKKLCKFGNEDSFTSGVLIGDNRQAVVAKYGDNDNIFVVDLERGYIASRWKNSSEHYGSQLIRDPHDPNIIFASPFLAPAFTMWDVRQGGKAPVRTIGRSPRGNCMRKPLNCWNRNAIFHGNDEGIYAYDIGTSKLLLKTSIDGAYGMATYGNGIVTTCGEEWLMYDLNSPDEPVQKLNGARCADLEMDHSSVFGNQNPWLYYATYE